LANERDTVKSAAGRVRRPAGGVRDDRGVVIEVARSDGACCGSPKRSHRGERHSVLIAPPPVCGRGGSVSLIGPTLPTWAMQQVGGYLGYTGRAANVIAKAAL